MERSISAALRPTLDRSFQFRLPVPDDHCAGINAHQISHERNELPFHERALRSVANYGQSAYQMKNGTGAQKCIAWPVIEFRWRRRPFCRE